MCPYEEWLGFCPLVLIRRLMSRTLSGNFLTNRGCLCNESRCARAEGKAAAGN